MRDYVVAVDDEPRCVITRATDAIAAATEIAEVRMFVLPIINRLQVTDAGQHVWAIVTCDNHVLRACALRDTVDGNAPAQWMRDALPIATSEDRATYVRRIVAAIRFIGDTRLQRHRDVLRLALEEVETGCMVQPAEFWMLAGLHLAAMDDDVQQAITDVRTALRLERENA